MNIPHAPVEHEHISQLAASTFAAGVGCLPNAQTSQLLLSRFMQDPELPEDSFSEYMLANQPRMLECKVADYLYSIHNEQGELVGFSRRPDACLNPFCANCKREKQEQRMRRYAPYLDDLALPLQSLWHVITTSPAVPRSELPALVERTLRNDTRFHEKLRKSLGYPIAFLVVHEFKYQRQDNTYYAHSHYGILNKLFSLIKFRKLYQKTFGRNYIVKFPTGKHGNKKPRVNKWAFLEYCTRRATEQPLTMPARDFFEHLMHRQLVKLIGYSKVQSRIVKTIRKSYTPAGKLPDGWHAFPLGRIPKNFNLEHYGERYRFNFNAMHAELVDTLTLSHIAHLAHRDSLAETLEHMEKINMQALSKTLQKEKIKSSLPAFLVNP
jgi:hypothetical protein